MPDDKSFDTVKQIAKDLGIEIYSPDDLKAAEATAEKKGEEKANLAFAEAAKEAKIKEAFENKQKQAIEVFGFAKEKVEEYKTLEELSAYLLSDEGLKQIAKSQLTTTAVGFGHFNKNGDKDGFDPYASLGSKIKKEKE